MHGRSCTYIRCSYNLLNWTSYVLCAFNSVVCPLVCVYFPSLWLFIWDKVFKSGPSKICGRQPSLRPIYSPQWFSRSHCHWNTLPLHIYAAFASITWGVSFSEKALFFLVVCSKIFDHITTTIRCSQNLVSMQIQITTAECRRLLTRRISDKSPGGTQYAIHQRNRRNFCLLYLTIPLTLLCSYDLPRHLLPVLYADVAWKKLSSKYLPVPSQH